MKVLFSTKYLSSMIKKALNDTSFNEIEFRREEWILKSTDKVDLVLKVVHTIDSPETELDSLKIDRVQWFKLMTFLEPLPEQPIVLELLDYSNDDIDIILSQFTAEF